MRSTTIMTVHDIYAQRRAERKRRERLLVLKCILFGMLGGFVGSALVFGVLWVLAR